MRLPRFMLRRSARGASDQQSLQDLYNKPTPELTDDDIRRLYQAPDAAHFRFSGTSHLLPILEASRRLREAMRREERTIRRLTWVLVALTIALVCLTTLEYCQHRSDVEATQRRALDASAVSARQPGGSGSRCCQ